MHGDTELFAHVQDMVEAEWRVVDPVLGEDATPLYAYDPGTWGPAEADELVAPDGGWCRAQLSENVGRVSTSRSQMLQLRQALRMRVGHADRRSRPPPGPPGGAG